MDTLEKFPSVIFDVGDDVERDGGPSLSTFTARVEMTIGGEFRNAEMIGDGIEIDFIRFIQQTQTYIHWNGRYYDLQHASNIIFHYCLTYARIEYQFKEIPLKLIKYLFSGSPSSSNFGMLLELHSLSTNPLTLGILFSTKFALGDPFYTYADWQHGWVVHNRMLPKYIAVMQGNIDPPAFGKEQHVWIRETTFKRQILKNQALFINDKTSIKPSEDSTVILQYSLVLPPTSVGRICVNLAGGLTEIEVTQQLKPLLNEFRKNHLDSYLHDLHKIALTYFRFESADQILNQYAAIALKTAGTYFLIQQIPFLCPGHHYPRFYARDSYWHFHGLLLLHQESVVKIALESYFHHQNVDGSFPTSLNLNGTVNYFSPDAADLDSTMFPLLSMITYTRWTRDPTLFLTLFPQVCQALIYLKTRDIDQDGWIEQGPNQDWADTMHRVGKITYSQAVYYALLQGISEITTDFPLIAKIGAVIGQECRSHAQRMKNTFDATFWSDEFGIYVDHIKPNEITVPVVNQDVCLAIVFGLASPERAQQFLAQLKARCWTAWGPSKQEPYPDATRYGPPGFYHNGGVWGWAAAFEVAARLQFHQYEDALWVIRRVWEYDSGNNPYKYYYFQPTEWFSSVTGENEMVNYKQAKFFATGAGSFLWALFFHPHELREYVEKIQLHP